MIRVNPTQLTVDQAYEERHHQFALDTIRVHESIRPLERRRQHALAALVRSHGFCRRAA